MRTDAYLSQDRRYRYWLTRSWDTSLPMLCVIGVNPSTADENIDDPTIRKCLGFANRLRFGSLLMLNVGAYRSTDPREWIKAIDPFGPENTVSLRQYITERSLALKYAPPPASGTSIQKLSPAPGCEAGLKLTTSTSGFLA